MVMTSGLDSFSVLSSTDTERRGGFVQEEVVIIDEDDADDDMVVEATVRSIQMAEDEAFARSLQVSAIYFSLFSDILDLYVLYIVHSLQAQV